MRRELDKAEEVTSPPALTVFEYPKANAEAFNWQGRLDWTSDDGTAFYASVSRRARFPTTFERFSTQFGNAASNPGLKPERATQFELGGSKTFGGLTAEAAIFYSDINDAIVAVRPAGFPANTSQRRNLGKAHYYGAELALTARLGETLEMGANYSYIHRTFDITPEQNVTVPVFALTDVPKHKGFAYADWSLVPIVHIVPSVEVASSRTTLDTYVPTAPGTVRYYQTGSYVQAGLRVDVDVMDNVTIGVGARNLFDDNYTLTDGFPEPGRSFFASLRTKY